MRIAPSVLAADFTRLGEEVLAAQQAGADWLHLDVMDGRFVPNISFGLGIVEAIKRVSGLPLDVHLMIVEPERYVADFVRAGATYLSFHSEATLHPHRTIQNIRELGAKPGLAINPGTPLSTFEPLLPDLDLALLMTVNPGFGGQRFIASSIKRLEQLRSLRDELNPQCFLEVDGGVNAQNIAALKHAGADIAVAGSSVFNLRASVHDNLSELRRQLANSR